MNTIKLPEKLSNRRRIVENESGDIVASTAIFGFSHEQSEAFAAELVKRWNEHDRLVEQNKALREALQAARKVVLAQTPEYNYELKLCDYALALAGMEGDV